MAKNNARLINEDVVGLYNSAGINPVTGQPTRVTDNRSSLKNDIRKQLRIIDEQDAVNRYVWYNLPCDLTGQELERMLYYKGQLAFFYFKDLDQFYFMPYALDGTIDFYGRFNTIHPVPMAEGTDDDTKAIVAKQAALLSTIKLDVLYDVPLELDKSPENYCVLLHDYTKQLSQNILPRQQLQDGLLNVMSDMIPFMRTSLLNATGVSGMRVASEDDESNVKAANLTVDSAALNGQKWIPIIGNLEFQDLTQGSTAKGEEFLLAMQSLDNFRLSTYGLENGGLFEKKQYQNTMQTSLNGNGQVGNPLQDGLSIRQHFCDVVNSIFGVGISCEISEVATGSDFNQDGAFIDEQDQSGTMVGQQPEQGDVE